MSYTVEDLDDAIRAWAYAIAKVGGSGYVYLDDESEVEDVDPGQAWQELEAFLDWKDNKFIYLPGIGSLELAQVHGGGEGGGEDYHVIVRITGENVGDGPPRTFKRNGWYASFDGGYLEGPTVEGKIVVKAVEVFE